jgi:hypothetical protein
MCNPSPLVNASLGSIRSILTTAFDLPIASIYLEISHTQTQWVLSFSPRFPIKETAMYDLFPLVNASLSSFDRSSQVHSISLYCFYQPGNITYTKANLKHKLCEVCVSILVDMYRLQLFPVPFRDDLPRRAFPDETSPANDRVGWGALLLDTPFSAKNRSNLLAYSMLAYKP